MSAPIFMRAIQIAYTLSGHSDVELFHDAILVCHEAESVCEAYIDDEQARPEWRLTLDACLTRSEAWIGNSEEPYAVLGCSPEADILVVEIDYNEARTLGTEEVKP